MHIATSIYIACGFLFRFCKWIQICISDLALVGSQSIRQSLNVCQHQWFSNEIDSSIQGWVVMQLGVIFRNVVRYLLMFSHKWLRNFCWNIECYVCRLIMNIRLSKGWDYAFSLPKATFSTVHTSSSRIWLKCKVEICTLGIYPVKLWLIKTLFQIVISNFYQLQDRTVKLTRV